MMVVVEGPGELADRVGEWEVRYGQAESVRAEVDNH